MLTACGGDGSLAVRSGGRPYEVVVVGTDNVAMSEVSRCLEMPVEGLPQPEPSFDVTTVDSLTYSTSEVRRMRSIVNVVLTGNNSEPVSMSYERNVEAQPQLLVTLRAGSAAQLQCSRQRWQQPLLQLLSSFEAGVTRALLRKSLNQAATDSLRRRFGVEVLVPSEMLSSRYEQDFVWLSNNAPSAMQNICVFTGDSIDAVIGRHIKGETDSMHMALVRASIKESSRQEAADASGGGKQHATRREQLRTMRGLWEMTGDAMGGPFVAHIITDTLTGRTITVLAFVYAPESRKRNLMRRLEAAITHHPTPITQHPSPNTPHPSPNTPHPRT